jgi:molybdenum cofactor cytidylyltransferase
VAALLDNYEIVNPSMDDLLQSDSLRAGLVRAEALGATRVVVVLGDMPFVTSSLIAKIMGKCTTTMPAAATDGFIAKPPACFPAARFSDLMSLSGDRGAGGLFKDLPKSSLATSRRHNELVDVDTPGTLSRLNELSG